jgi:hypothetical protein
MFESILCVVYGYHYFLIIMILIEMNMVADRVDLTLSVIPRHSEVMVLIGGFTYNLNELQLRTLKSEGPPDVKKKYH